MNILKTEIEIIDSFEFQSHFINSSILSHIAAFIHSI